MELTVHIPDEIAPHLQVSGSDLSRRALEALALAEYKSGRISTAQMRKMLGFSTVTEIDGFLKDHGVLLEYTMEDLEQDRAALRRFLEP
jgi:hypothetical protein